MQCYSEQLGIGMSGEIQQGVIEIWEKVRFHVWKLLPLRSE